MIRRPLPAHMLTEARALLAMGAASLAMVLGIWGFAVAVFCL